MVAVIAGAPGWSADTQPALKAIDGHATDGPAARLPWLAGRARPVGGPMNFRWLLLFLSKSDD